MAWNNLSIPKLQQRNRWNVGRDKLLHAIFYSAGDYFSMLGLKLIRVSKKSPDWEMSLWHVVVSSTLAVA